MFGWGCYFFVYLFQSPFNRVVWNNLTVTTLKLGVIKVVEGCGFPLGKYHALLSNSAYLVLTLAFLCKGQALFEQCSAPQVKQ